MKIKSLLEVSLKRISKKYTRLILWMSVISLLSLSVVFYSFFLVNNYFDKDNNNSEYVIRIGCLDDVCDIQSKRGITTLDKNQIVYAEAKAEKIIKWQEMEFNENIDSSDYKLYYEGELLSNNQTCIRIKILQDKKCLTPFDLDDFMLLDNGFSDNPNEIIVSEYFLEEHGLNYDVLGNSISLAIHVENLRSGSILVGEQGTSIGYDDIEYYNYGDVYCFKDYRIIGIIKKQYYSHDIVNDNCDFWIAYESSLDSNGGSILESMRQYREKLIITYNNPNILELSEQLTNDGRFFCIYPLMHYKYYEDYANNTRLPEYRMYVVYNSFSDFKDIVNYIDGCYLENGAANNHYSYYTYSMLIELRKNTAYVWSRICFMVLLVLTISSSALVYFDGIKLMVVNKKGYSQYLFCVGMSKIERVKSLWFCLLGMYLIAIVFALIVYALFISILSIIISSRFLAYDLLSIPILLLSFLMSSIILFIVNLIIAVCILKKYNYVL